MVMGPVEPETKNDCSGEDQQLFAKQPDRTRMRYMGYVARLRQAMNAYKPGRRGPLGRTRYRCEDKSKMNLEETGSEVVDWVSVVPHRILLVGK
jgi:hypothetical protein